MTSRKHLGLLSLFILVVAAGVVVVTQDVDPTGHATGLAPSAGLIEVEFTVADLLTVYPPPGATDVPTSWDGNEVPQPPAPPQGYPSGPVITVQGQGEAFDVVDAKIMVHGTDTAIPATVLRVGEDANLSARTMGLIPHKPLAELTTHTVVFTDAEGAVVAEWPFTTGAAECDPTAQDCGRGQACYLVDGSPACIWAGAKHKGEECTFLNACGPGMACFRGSCEAYCDASPSADPDVGCKDQCAQGGYDILGAETSHAKICLPMNCLVDGAQCPTGEGCYRFNEVYLCAPEGPSKAGGPCQYPNDCASGSTCMGLDGVFSCRQLCDGGAGRPDCDDVCDGGYSTIIKEPLVRYCR